MKAFFLSLTLLFSVQSFSEDSFHCKKIETDKACLNRAVKESEDFRANYYDGNPSEKPGPFLAIYSNNPTVHLMSQFGEGNDEWKTYILIYKVAPQEDGNFALAAGFSATLNKFFDDEGKVLGRAVDLKTVKLLINDEE